MASANAILLNGLLERDFFVSFYSKPSFVDPRPILNGHGKELRFVDCTNHWADGVRRRMSPRGGGLWGHFWGQFDASIYNRGLVRAMRQSPVDGIDLWLGDWARGRGKRPVVSFAQGPPGTDARSVFTHRALIQTLSGNGAWRKLSAAARWRLGPGLPSFKDTDHVIVGSDWSRQFMVAKYGAAETNTHALPYPIDIEAFGLPTAARQRNNRLRLFWLGRFAPRKRLDLFLDGLSLAIREGCDAEAWVVGSSAFAPGFETLLKDFPYQQRLRHWPRVSRDEVPGMLAEIDVMAQPSDEENFGSSVAEALACGVPSIVGATNGTGDYICSNSIQLTDDAPESFAAAVVEMAARKREGRLLDRAVSRAVAEKWFTPKRVLDRLIQVLELVNSES